MKAVLVIDMPSRCFGCKLHRVIYGENENEFMVFCCPLRRPVNDLDKRPSWCPLSHPLKSVSNDFYIYDRKYLFAHLDREIGLLKGTKAFEEFMKAREDESSIGD